MKNPPPELTTKWVKANLPDLKETKPLKAAVEQMEKQMLAFALPGDLTMKDFQGIGKGMDAIVAEVKKLQAVKLTDAKVKEKLAKNLFGYENAIKIARNYYKTMQVERNQLGELYSTAVAATSALRSLLNTAEKELPGMANKLTHLLDAFNKAPAAAEKKKILTEAKKLMEAGKATVLAPKNKTWEQHWQQAQFGAHLDKLTPKDKATIKKALDELSVRVVKIVKLCDLVIAKAKPLVP